MNKFLRQMDIIFGYLLVFLVPTISLRTCYWGYECLGLILLFPLFAIASIILGLVVTFIGNRNKLRLLFYLPQLAIIIYFIYALLGGPI